MYSGMTVVSNNITISWNMMLSSLIESTSVWEKLADSCLEDGGSWFLQNHLPNYAASLPRSL